MTTNYDDELQRCLDEDLNDDEMRMLFSHLAKDAGLRKDFRALLTLKREMQVIPVPAVHSPLPVSPRMFSQNRVSLRRTGNTGILDMISSRISIRVPIFALIVFAVGIAGYLAAVSVFPVQPKTEYVYVVEMPPVVIHSNYIQ